MNLKFWKHKQKAEVIKPECYDKLPGHLQQNYEPSDDEPTHFVTEPDDDDDDNDNFSTSLLSGLLDSESGSLGSIDTGAADSNSFGGFDGGDGGGGGATSDY